MGFGKGPGWASSLCVSLLQDQAPLTEGLFIGYAGICDTRNHVECTHKQQQVLLQFAESGHRSFVLRGPWVSRSAPPCKVERMY